MNEKYIKILEQAGIPESAVENSFSHATIARGIKYFESNRAEITEIESRTGHDILIHANVFGSFGYAYAIIVTLKVTRQYISIIGECDCPVGFRCKHAVATLLQFAYANAQKINEQGELGEVDKERVAELEVKLWLDELGPEAQRKTRSNDETSPAHNNVLLYLLRPSEDDKGMEIVSVTSRRLKKGGYGKSKVQSLEELVDGYSLHINYEHFEQDYEIAGLLYSMLGRGLMYRQNVYPLKGDIGELALEKLLMTGRCFWLTQERQTPLHKGHKRELSIAWENEEGQYHISAAVSPPAQELIHLKHFYYIDTQTNQVGIVEHKKISAQQLQSLLSAPPVPEKMAEKVSQKLIHAWPESELPLPVESGIETIIVNEKPIADILLHSVSTDGHRVHVLSLRFVYGEHLIQSDTAETSYGLLKEKQRYIIQRDLASEQACAELLQQHHFVPASKAGLSAQSHLDFIILADSLSDSVWLWHDFQNDIIPQLQEQGWVVRFDDSFYLQIEEANEWYGELEQEKSSDWFEISLGIELDGKNINLLPSLVELLVTEQNPQQLREKILSRDHIMLPVIEGFDHPRWVKLPADRVMVIFDTLVELYDSEALNQSGKLVLNRHQGLQIGALLNQSGMKWKGAGELQALSKKLQDFKGIEQIKPPKGLQTELRDYQRYGLNWLQFLRDYQFNGILADDMGLGKTVQTLAHLLYEKLRNQKNKTQMSSLVIAPTSLMGNWKREAKRFTPDLKVLILHGAERQEMFDSIEQYDIVLTTYALILRDKDIHSQQHYHYVILDESQNIKNARSKTAQLIFQLKSTHRLCLTGTPMENHLGELWSLFHFLMPGFLGPLDRFNRLFRNPIEKQGDHDRQLQLHKRVKPFMLRRTKEMVATELPQKTDMIRTIPLSGKQRDLYETVRLAMDRKVRDEISKKGFARSQIMILDALLKLRQVCCDPRLLALSSAKDVHVSAKLDMLMEMVPEMVEEGRKILIFSQFVKMLNLIEDELKKHNIAYTKLTGQTRHRDQAIESFQNGEADVFLISLKAGGVGLNLTAADTVIHYDPWWNPAVEKQATDRAYRIGQDKPVFVYKLLTEETVEEKILQMQQSKQSLADGLYQDKKAEKQAKSPEAEGPKLSQDDLLELLKPLD